MNYFKSRCIKYLKKAGFFKVFNFNLSIKIGTQKIAVPIVQNIGYSNISVKRTWLHELVNYHCADNKEVFVDVGANVGQTLIGIKSINTQISYLGFEPNIACAFYLNELIKRNKFDNTIILNLALSNKVGKLFLEKNYEDDPRASIIKELRPNYFFKTEIVFSVNYDLLGFQNKIGVVKIDVEGAEYEVLLGMEKIIKQDRPIVICEILDSHSKDVFAFTQERASLVVEFLRKNNYSVIQLEQNIKGGKIVSFFKREDIIIRQYTSQSIRFNDYIFYPEEKEVEIYEYFKNVTRKSNS